MARPRWYDPGGTIGKHVTVINNKTGRCNGVHSKRPRGFEFRTGVMIEDRHTRVVVAVRYDRPAVISTSNDQIQLIAVARNHLIDPQTSVGIKIDAQHVAVTDGPELLDLMGSAQGRTLTIRA